MAKEGKNIAGARKKVDRDKQYDVQSAMEMVLDSKYAKFDESVDVAVRLNVNPRHADQMVRGACVLPHGLGKSVRVLVFAKGDKAAEATAAGADVVGEPLA